MMAFQQNIDLLLVSLLMVFSSGDCLGDKVRAFESIMLGTQHGFGVQQTVEVWVFHCDGP